VPNVLHISVSLELGARIVSHLCLGRRARDFYKSSVFGTCRLVRERRTGDGSHDLTPEAQRFLLLHELFSPSAITNLTFQVVRLHVPASEHSFLEAATSVSLSSPTGLLFVASC